MPKRSGADRSFRRGKCAPLAVSVVLAVLAMGGAANSADAAGQVPPVPCDAPGCAGEPCPDMPPIAPIGARIGKYIEVPDTAKGPPVDPAKGYRIQRVGRGMYVVTENVYQSMFVVYESGVIVIDALQTLAAFIPKAIAEVTDEPITHLIYSHSHADHIGGARSVGGAPVIVAQMETKRILEAANDPNRPIPTQTFVDRFTLQLGSQVLELSYHGNAHAPGNIYIQAPEQKVLMVVDIILPGWMPFRRFSLAQDIPGYFRQVAEIDGLDFDVLVAGHVARTGTKADARMQPQFINELRDAAGQAQQATKPGLG